MLRIDARPALFPRPVGAIAMRCNRRAAVLLPRPFGEGAGVRGRPGAAQIRGRVTSALLARLGDPVSTPAFGALRSSPLRLGH